MVLQLRFVVLKNELVAEWCRTFGFFSEKASFIIFTTITCRSSGFQYHLDDCV